MLAADLRLEDLFAHAPSGGILRFAGQRTVLLDAVALGLLRTQLIETFGITVAKGLLTRLGYAHGVRTAEAMKDAVPWRNEREWRIAGGRLHRLQGLVSFEPVQAPEKRDPKAFAEAIWRDSVEAEQHVLHRGVSDEAVCWMLTGFASGYLSTVNQKPIYCVEVSCCGKGDSVCHMVGRLESDWGEDREHILSFYERECLDESLRTLRGEMKALEAQLAQRRRQLAPDINTEDGLVARSAGMRRVLERARQAARVDTTVLICGESGTGKERVARYIHDRSPRTAAPFIGVNCGALSEQLIESELFGHVQGAFTGANRARAGLFEAANGGTLFLDEIGEVPHPVQVRLLRVLQEREVRRVGDNVGRAVDVRVLAATNRDLEEMVAAGTFRRDLYYRLKVLDLIIPPLRERRDDILPIAHMHLLETAKRFGRAVGGFAPDAARQLVAYDFPGNVRELQNLVERAVVFATGQQLRPEDFPDLSPTGAQSAPAAGGPVDLSVRPLADIEREAILRTLAATGGNRTEAARRLGIGPATLFRRLRAYRAEGFID